LRDASPYLVIDLVVLRRSVPERFLSHQQNGVPAVVFDRTGDIAPTELDATAHEAAMWDRLAILRDRFDLFQAFVTKEVERRNAIGAIEAFHAITMRPLVEVLGMMYVPERFSFGAHYAHLDYPSDVVARLARLWYPSDLDRVEAHRAEADSWFHEVVERLDRHRT
jgi:hypothetical protein